MSRLKTTLSSLLCLLFCLIGPCAAQEVAAPETAANAPAANAPDDAWQAVAKVRDETARGRLLLEAGAAQSRPVLRAAAQDALKLVLELVGPDVLSGQPALPQTGAPADALRQASRAHLLWGVAADKFGGALGRDEAITAWARALKLAGDDNPEANVPAADARFRLTAVLRQGLPLVATDDALQTIAHEVHGDLWTPQRFPFDLSTLRLEPGTPVEPGTPEAALGAQQLLVTSGKLFPPALTGNAAGSDDEAELARVPPFYRVVAPEALPPALKLDRLALGYARETSGPNRGLWRKVVRVYYASPYLTKDHRDDSARAEALCAQFLKIHALLQTALGLENPHTDDRVTTLWLLEISALWPNDDEDPQVQAELGLHTPLVNTPQMPGGRIELPVEVTPYETPWQAAGQTAAAPGEVMFYRMGEARSEGEWLRQLAHEYGHVVLPPFDGFEPPLEPFGNGKLGETLALLWAAQLPIAQMLPPNLSSSDEDGARLTAQLDGYVTREIAPALQLWNTSGPQSPLRHSGASDGLRYLRGLAVYVERVYGAHVLGAALQKVAVKSAAPSLAAPPLTAQSLLDAIAQVLRAKTETPLPVWLPGAFAGEQASSALTKRAPATLAANTRAAAWLYVPATASTLRVFWQGAQPPRIEGDWQQTTPMTPGERTLDIAVAGHAGWQRFVFVAPAVVEVAGAQFLRAAPP
jgi:hypothetical protein